MADNNSHGLIERRRIDGWMIAILCRVAARLRAPLPHFRQNRSVGGIQVYFFSSLDAFDGNVRLASLWRARLAVGIGSNADELNEPSHSRHASFPGSILKKFISYLASRLLIGSGWHKLFLWW